MTLEKHHLARPECVASSPQVWLTEWRSSSGGNCEAVQVLRHSDLTEWRSSSSAA